MTTFQAMDSGYPVTSFNGVKRLIV